MWVVAAITAVMSLIKGMNEASALRKASADQASAAREAKQIADQNAANLEKQNVEQERRAKAQQQKEEAQARAAAFASGFDGDTGSIALSLAEQQKENLRQFQYMQGVNKSNVDIVKRQGSYAYSQAKAQADATKSRSKAARLGAILNAGKSAYSLWGGPASGPASVNVEGGWSGTDELY